MAKDRQNNSSEIEDMGIAHLRLRPHMPTRTTFKKIGNIRIRLAEIRGYSTGTANLFAFNDIRIREDVKLLAENVRYLEIAVMAMGRFCFIENVKFELPKGYYNCGIKLNDERLIRVECTLDDLDKIVAELDDYFL